MIRNLFKISLLSLFISPFLVSQELTSDITGTVSTSTGSVSGAQVEITYEPTNTSITRTTDESGRYFAGGLRPGGPYTITVSAAGLVSQNATTTLVVGDTRRLSFSMASADLVDELIVTGSRVTVDRDGFTTLIDAETIANTPSVTRDIKDILKLNPFVTLDDEEMVKNLYQLVERIQELMTLELMVFHLMMILVLMITVTHLKEVQ